MKNEIITFIKNRQLLTENATVLIGVSGGPDSMALLHLFVSLREQWNLQLVVLTVDHQLRGEESATDVQYVKDVCKQWDVEVVSTGVNVQEYERTHRVGTQVAARELRYQFFHEQMEHYHGDYLALGHHGDDQAETMFMSLTRAANSRALSGIPVKRQFSSGMLIRPLLIVSKEKILQYCKENNLHPRIDPSNENIDITRVFFRKKIIPLIKEKNDNIHTTIQYLSESLHEDELYIQQEAKQLIKEVVQFDENEKKSSFQMDEFKSYAQALQRRAYQLILNYLYNGKLPKDLSYTHESNFFTLIREPYGTVKINFPQQLIIERSYELISFYFDRRNTDNQLHEIVAVPGTIKLRDGSLLTAQVVSEKEHKEDKYTYFCTMESISLPLNIRTRRAGDRISWKGLNGSKKLKDLFIDEKVPRDQRDSWPIVVDQDENILWVIGLKKGEFNKFPETTSWIKLQFKKNNKQGE